MSDAFYDGRSIGYDEGYETAQESKIEDIQFILNFFEKTGTFDLSQNYCRALKLLGEKAKDRWTEKDVIQTILRLNQ